MTETTIEAPAQTEIVSQAMESASTEATLKESETSRVNEANRRLNLLETYKAMVAAGKSKAAACRELEVGVATMWRWDRGFKKKGFNGLLPDTDKCGRKTALAKLGLSQETIDSVFAQMQGLNLDVKSDTSALRIFAQSDRCPEELARVILDPNRCSKHAIPKSLRQLVKVSKAMRLAHEGARSLSLNGIYTPRKLDILPGDIFSADDTTPIWAWWVPWVECEDYPFGVKLLQGQFLPVIDVASQKVLTFALIAREKSSYRASDIWALFGHTFETVGLPRLGWQLERGSWEANMIAGQEIEYQEGEVTLSRRVGGLRQLPTNPTAWHEKTMGEKFVLFPRTLQTWTSYLPKSKSIEAYFNRSQTLEGTLWGSLGRDQMRQPYEKMKKLFYECSRTRSKTDPRNYFLSQTEILTRLMAMARYLDNEPLEGEVFKGAPAQVFAQAEEQYPLLQLPDDMKWLYRRSWCTTQIRQGWARVRLTHDISGERYSLFYGNPTVFAAHEGEDVAVYYDREKFEEPAQIILARTGEYLCEAEYVDRRGSFLEGDKTGHDMRKQWKNAVITAYGTIAKHAPSRQLPPEIKARREAFKAQREQAPAPVTIQRLPIAPEPARRLVPEQEGMDRNDDLLARLAGRAREKRELMEE